MIDLTTNKKQAQLLTIALQAAMGLIPQRYIMFGGAQRGGKTIGILTTLAILCKMYPKSKWVCFRADFPELEKTTIPSMEKVLGGSTQWKWHRDKGNYRVVYENGSIIYFYGENIQNNPNFDQYLGLEVNGVFLEQCEGLSEKLFEWIKTRIGSHIIDPMPTGLIFMSCNPSQNWSKKLFYEPWRNRTLDERYCFIQALPIDNPYNTDEQYDEWDRLDEHTKRQMIEGDWTNFKSGDNLWAYAFDYKKHVVKELPPPDKNTVLNLSFDFNINPICCCVIQHKDNTIYVHESISLKNSDIYKLCDQIKVKYPGYVYIVGGDSTGQNSTAMVKDAWNYYMIISKELNVVKGQMAVPTINPSVADNQILINSLLQHYNIKIDGSKCEPLIYDLENVRVTPEGGIEKNNRTDLAQRADSLDAFRYYLFFFHRTSLLKKQGA